MALALLSALLVRAAGSASSPSFPSEYEMVIQMKIPYVPLEMPLRVLTSSTTQKIEYYDGLMVDVSSAAGMYRYAFNNSERTCMFTPPSAGPTHRREAALAFEGNAFFPDFSQYVLSGEELVGGILCQRYVYTKEHGSTGTMNDHISFYWDAVLQKPVRWHMHARQVPFPSHTDEWILDYLSFQAVAPSDADLALPKDCVSKPRTAKISSHLHHFLQAAHSSLSISAEESTPLLFSTYLAQYGKTYTSEEYNTRLELFKRNLRKVQEMNKKHAGRATFKGNQFLDMTKEEVMAFRGGKSKATTRHERRTAEQSRFVRSHEPDGRDLPKDFDWRTERPGVVSPVKDQGMCGSCWTYGVTEPAESIQAINSDKPLVELPEQFVLDCTWTNNTGSSGQNSGCDGGDSDIGALEIVRKFGGVIPKAEAYGSYLSVDGYCRDIKSMDVGAKIEGWVDVKDRDEEAVMHALVTKGPLSIGIQVPDDMLYYDSGVLKVDSCKNNETDIDHADRLIGFGTDENGVDYYIVRNSWSTYWRDQGYIKIARGDNDCCVSCQAGYPDMAPPAESIVV